MIRFAIGVAGIAGLASCSVPDLSAEQAQKMTNLQLCQTYSVARTYNNSQHMNRAKWELKRRGALSDRDISDITSQTIRTGMKEHVAVCSWGPYEDINTTVVGSHESKQFVIDLGTYFYTRNGRVYAWQD